MIISAAIFEGASFFFIVAYKLEHSPFSLAAAVAPILSVAAREQRGNQGDSHQI
jgi:hypothetical protein